MEGSLERQDSKAFNDTLVQLEVEVCSHSDLGGETICLLLVSSFHMADVLIINCTNCILSHQKQILSH